MKTTVKHISETKVNLTIALDANEVKAAEEVALTRLGKEVKAAGFRKGKAPLSVVAKTVTPTALAEETVDVALNKAIVDAFTAENLRPLDRPKVDVKKFVPNQEIEFTAEVEVLPEITLGDHKKISLTKQPAIKVAKKEVDEIISRIQKDLSEKKSVDRKAKEGDEVVIDFVGKIDGKEFDGGKAEGHTLELGSGAFIPGFEEGVVGHKKDETFDVEVTFPKEYHAKEMAGKKAVFTVTIKDIKEITLPEVNDELAQKAGPYKTAADLKNEIETGIKARKTQEQQDELREEAVKKFVEKCKVAVPEILRNDHVESIEKDLKQNLMYRGMSIDTYIESQGFKNRDEWMEKDVYPVADARVKANLVLMKLADKLDITVSEEELKEKIAEFRQRYGGNPEMAKRFEEPGVQQNILSSMRNDKAVEQLVELNQK